MPEWSNGPGLGPGSLCLRGFESSFPHSAWFVFFFSFSFILSLSSRSRRSRSSLYRFRIVTSVIPATSATSRWVFFSSLISAAT